jgi:6-phosphogluconolactonase
MERAFIGTYTKKEAHVNGLAKGILYLEWDRHSGEIINLETVADVVNPSFVKLAPNTRVLYAVSELGSGEAESGFIYAYKIIEGSKLTQISKLPTGGFAPAHIEIDKAGKHLFVSNYVGGVVAVYNMLPDGDLKRSQTINLPDQESSHAHSTTISSTYEKIYIADLGNDCIWIYDWNAQNGEAVRAEPFQVKLKKDSGPRHFTILESHQSAYVVNELNNTINVFRLLPKGDLEVIQEVSSLPKGFDGKNSAADLHIHPSGKWIYVSNRGHNSIAVFKVAPKTGQLELLEVTSTSGKIPRGFAVSASGEFLYVANQDTNNIVTFSIKDNGSLEFMAETAEVLTPVWVELME